MVIGNDRVRGVGLAVFLAIVSAGSCPAVDAGTGTGRLTSQPSRAEAVLRRLGKGIVVEAASCEEGSPHKILYDPALYDAVKSAGFQSVRFYVVAGRDPAVYKRRIDDALHRGLAVVISLWGKSRWASEPKEGLREFVEAWDEFATFYKDYPQELVFDLWNEPAGLWVQNGKPVGIKESETVMKYLNAVIPVIRKTNPDRVLAIGGPGFNGCRDLWQFVTPEYLTYRLQDGTGFEEDDAIIGMVHMYQPQQFTHWIMPLDRLLGWRDQVREQLAYAVAWSKRWGKPVLIGEWGAWAPPCHSTEDFKAYLRFVVNECKKHNIGWMYYCAGYNNQWAFNILNTEDGWNQDALDVLTGVTAPPPPPLSPVVNAEFLGTDHWIAAGTVKISMARNAGLSGPTALRVEAKKSDRAEVYQETPKGKGAPPGRYLISVRKGRRYRISFLARSVGGTGIVRVRLADASDPRNGFWTSAPLVISTAKREYTVEYRHTGPDVEDVRLTFLFGEKDQTILLDRVVLHRIPSARTEGGQALRIEGKPKSRFGGLGRRMFPQLKVNSFCLPYVTEGAYGSTGPSSPPDASAP